MLNCAILKYARMSIFLFCSIKLLKSILWQWPDLNFLLVTVDRLYCIDRKKKQNNLPDENCAVFFSFVVLSEHSYVANQFTLGVGLFHLTKRCKKKSTTTKIKSWKHSIKKFFVTLKIDANIKKKKREVYLCFGQRCIDRLTSYPQFSCLPSKRKISKYLAFSPVIVDTF